MLRARTLRCINVKFLARRARSGCRRDASATGLGRESTTHGTHINHRPSSTARPPPPCTSTASAFAFNTSSMLYSVCHMFTMAPV